jgi:hypothetical protein
MESKRHAGSCGQRQEMNNEQGNAEDIPLLRSVDCFEDW